MKLLIVIATIVGGAAVALAVAVKRPAEHVEAASVTPPAAVTAPTVATQSSPVAAPAKRARPIPGGVASWTGREGTQPGDMEEFAKASGMPLPLALEQHRSTLLEEQTSDPKRLAEILDQQPSAEMLSKIHQHLVTMHDATANIQVHAREGKLSERDAIDQTRAAEDAYLQGFRDATGLSAAQLDQFFAREPAR